MEDVGFRVQGSGFRVQGLGFRLCARKATWNNNYRQKEFDGLVFSV
jgi:hypothetical protein